MSLRAALGAGLAALLSLLIVTPLELHASSGPVPVIDLHVDLPYRSFYKGKPFAIGSGEFRAEDLVKAGVSGVVLPLFVPEDAKPAGRTEAQLEASYAHVFRHLVLTRPYSLPGCGTRSGGGEARAVETFLAFEGAEALAAEREVLASWALRGVRSFGLVHSEHNDLATSSGEAVQGRGGLTPRGRRFAELVYEVGGVVDVSHASDEATEELVAVARRAGAPLIATHSNARALAAHPRNLTDRHIQAIGRSGGVVGVNFHKRFLAPASGEADLDDVVAQIEYLARVGGPGVVAIGSDYEGGIRPANELSDASRFQALARRLADRGHSSAAIRGFLSENARRVLCRGGERAWNFRGRFASTPHHE